jgi:hypothetical protein
VIGKVIKAVSNAGRKLAGAVRLLRYMLVPKPDPRLPGLHMESERLLSAPQSAWLPQVHLPTLTTAREWATAMAGQLAGLTRALRADAPMPTKLFEHLLISFHPGDTARMGSTDGARAARIREIVGEALLLLGLDDHPRVLVVHGDTRHLHAHIVLGTVSLHGRIWNPGREELRRFEEAMEALELKHGLQRVVHRLASANADERRLPPMVAPTFKEHLNHRRTGRPSVRARLQEILPSAVSASKDFPDFVDRVERAGARLVLYQFERGRLGCAFRMDGVTLSGSRIGRDFSWPKLAPKVRFKPVDPDHQAIVDVKVASATYVELTPSLTIRCVARRGKKPLRARALPRLTAQTEGATTLYRWNPRAHRVALRARSDQIEVVGYSPDGVSAALELAAQRGWSSIVVRGTGLAVDRARTVAGDLGLRLTPPPRGDLPDLNAWRARRRTIAAPARPTPSPFTPATGRRSQ